MSKFIISNISDVITNSSSEVYVMEESSLDLIRQELNNYSGSEGCISIHKIDWDLIKSYGRYELDLFCSALGVECFSFYPSDDEMDAFMIKHKKEIEDKLIGKYYVDIEDHFVDSEYLMDYARSISICSENNH